jgi:hypothetical protein
MEASGADVVIDDITELPAVVARFASMRDPLQTF